MLGDVSHVLMSTFNSLIWLSKAPDQQHLWNTIRSPWLLAQPHGLQRDDVAAGHPGKTREVGRGGEPYGHRTARAPLALCLDHHLSLPLSAAHHWSGALHRAVEDDGAPHRQGALQPGGAFLDAHL